MGHLGELAGVHVVLTADPLATAVRLADELGADLAQSPLEIHLALEERRRAARARRLAAAAHEARGLAAELGGHDEDQDRSLVGRAGQIRELAAAPDPRPLIEVVERHTAAVATSARRLESARRGVETARAAVPEVPEPDRRVLLDLDQAAARALAAEISNAAEDVRDAQRDLGPRPAVDEVGEAELRRVSQLLRQARAQVDGAGRRFAVHLVEGTGIAAVVAGVCIDQRVPAAVAAAAAALPLLVALVWSRRATAARRRHLGDTERRAEATVVRVLGAKAAAVAGPGADPLDVLDQLRARWNARAQQVAEADARLTAAQRRWAAVAGGSDPDDVEELLETAHALRRGTERLAEAAADLRDAEAAREAACRAWTDAVRSAGCGTRSVAEADAVRAELAERARLHQEARSLLPELEAAERRAVARRRLAELLAGRSLDDIAAGMASAEAGADGAAVPRPLVLADPLSGAEEARRQALRRQLADTDAACVLVTALPEAATWGFPVFDAVQEARESQEA